MNGFNDNKLFKDQNLYIHNICIKLKLKITRKIIHNYIFNKYVDIIIKIIYNNCLEKPLEHK